MNQLQQDKWSSVTIIGLKTNIWDQQQMLREDESVLTYQITYAVYDILWERMIFHLYRTCLLRSAKRITCVEAQQYGMLLMNVEDFHVSTTFPCSPRQQGVSEAATGEENFVPILINMPEL